MSQTVLITGATRGVGLETATHLTKLGYQVFGTSRTPDRYRDLPFPLLPLDVTDNASVAACLEALKQQAGTLDILINNAGYGLYGALEETSIDELCSQLETNLLGVFRVTQRVLPLMRQQQGGKIINISSLNGLFALPYNGSYAASKFALEGLSEALRYEMLPFGVYVSLVEPGPIRTASLDNFIRLSQNPVAAYQDSAKRIKTDILEMAERSGLSVDTVVKTIIRVVKQPKPRLRYPVGALARFLPSFKLLAPGIYERFMYQRFQPLAKNPAAAPSEKG
jgi:short-subunit dehydrogenase